jgi:hypothetical protein
MKSKILFSVIFTFIFLFLIPFSLGAEVKQAAAISRKGPSIFFPSIKHEFAPVAEGIVVRHHFIVQNKGDGALHINKVRTG